MISKCKESPNLWPRVIKFEHKHIKAHERALVAELKENQYVVAAYTTGDHRDYTSASKPCTWCSDWPCMHVVARVSQDLWDRLQWTSLRRPRFLLLLPAFSGSFVKPVALRGSCAII